jgi:AcrR family transcriptional regulator
VSVRTPREGSSSEGHLLRESSFRRLKPGPSQSPLDVAESQCERLQQAIVHLAAEEGVDAITVRKLTRLARVSTSAFYSRFSGIDDCLLTAYQERMSRAVETIAGTRTSGLEPVEQVDRTLRASLRDLLDDREVARFVLIEIYGGGPGAISVIETEERRIEAALRACLNRRERRVANSVVRAITAAMLHSARVALIDATLVDLPQMVDSLIEWARNVVEGKDEFGIALQSPRSSAPTPSLPLGRSAQDHPDDDLILVAILRLARTNGLEGLDASKVSSAAGLPVARFHRRFATVGDGYLTALRQTCRLFFAEITTPSDPDQPTRASIRDALQNAVIRAAADPSAAHLTFHSILEPGVAGLICRESLVAELAMACSDAGTPANSRLRFPLEASIAALWASLATLTLGDNLRSAEPFSGPVER